MSRRILHRSCFISRFRNEKAIFGAKQGSRAEHIIAEICKVRLTKLQPKDCFCNRNKAYETASKIYSGFAFIYDKILGDASFAHWEKYFTFLVKKYNIKFNSVADIACGTGNVVKYFSEEKKIVFGVDVSPSMLQVAKQRNYDAKFIKASFTDFKLPQKVDLMTCNFDSLNYILDRKELKKTFKRFFLYLNNFGWTIFDLNTIYHLRKNWGDREIIWEGRDYFSYWKTKWDGRKKISCLEMINFIQQKNGDYERRVELHQEKGYPLQELRRCIIESGFKIKGIFDIFTLRRIQKNTSRILFIVQKIK